LGSVRGSPAPLGIERIVDPEGAVVEEEEVEAAVVAAREVRFSAADRGEECPAVPIAVTTSHSGLMCATFSIR